MNARTVRSADNRLKPLRTWHFYRCHSGKISCGANFSHPVLCKAQLKWLNIFRTAVSLWITSLSSIHSGLLMQCLVPVAEYVYFCNKDLSLNCSWRQIFWPVSGYESAYNLDIHTHIASPLFILNAAHTEYKQNWMNTIAKESGIVRTP